MTADTAILPDTAETVIPREHMDAFLRMKRQLADMRARLGLDNPQPQQEHTMARPKKIYANAAPAGDFAPQTETGEVFGKQLPPDAPQIPAPAPNAVTLTADDLDALRQQAAAVDAAEAREVAEVNQLVGMAKASGFFTAVSRITLLKTLQTIKARKSYRGCVITNAQGEAVNVTTWAGLCEALGLGWRQVDRDLENLAFFGEDMLKAQQEMGIGYRDLRALRGSMQALPDHERADVRAMVDDAVASGDREEVLSTLEEIAARNRELTLEAEKAHAEAEDARKYAHDAQDKAYKLKEQLDAVKKLTPKKRAAFLAEKRRETHQRMRELCWQIMGLAKEMADVMAWTWDDSLGDMDGEKLIDATLLEKINGEVSLCSQTLRDTWLDAGIEVDFETDFTGLLFDKMQADDAADDAAE